MGRKMKKNKKKKAANWSSDCPSESIWGSSFTSLEKDSDMDSHSPMASGGGGHGHACTDGESAKRA